MALHKFTSTGPMGHVVSYDDFEGNLAVLYSGGAGPYATLSDRDKRELAFLLLAGEFDIHYESDGITLTKKRPRAEIGQYYRVNSEAGEDGGFDGIWAESPIVRVKEIYGVRKDGDLLVETETGETSTWGRNLHNLIGPLDVVEVTVKTEWRERADVEG